MSEFQSAFFPKSRNPYYIVAPRYVRTSAGVKVLHTLCHTLNCMGEQAFLITMPYAPPYWATHPTLHAPVLTQRVMDYHHVHGLTPITIYPEIIKGNPLNAPFVARYVLNYPGLLGGDVDYPEHEYCISYSDAIAQTVPRSRHTIFIPVSNPQFFVPPPANTVRRGGCFYAGKYQHCHGGKTFPLTSGMTEIIRDGIHAQTPEALLKLFQHCEVFYCYENSALAIEAMLCGCPVVFLPNPYFTDLIGKTELGPFGYAWGDSTAGLEHAKKTVSQMRTHYLALAQEAQQRISAFVKHSQEAAKHVQYVQPMSSKYVLKLTATQRYLSMARTLRLLIKERGLLYAANTIKKRLKAGRLTLYEL